jgi:hypothetical protein
MRAERRRDTGQLAFPNIALKDCIKWRERWLPAHPEMEPWQLDEIAKYERRDYAVSEIEDYRKRYGPLERNMIPNHAILAFEGSIHKRALRIIDELIPSQGESEWSGLVYDGHDSAVVQVLPHRVKYAIEVLNHAMYYEWRGMVFEGDARQIASLGDL